MKENNKTLESINSIFGLEEDENNIKEIDIEKLVPYKNHPFKLYSGKQFDDMVESIKEFGVMTPIIVRPIKNGLYEILAGHNRHSSSIVAGKTTIPAFVKKDLTDDEAAIIVTETNFMQRSLADMLPSEIAFAYKLKLDALNRMNKKGRKTEIVGKDYNVSKNTIDRYKRLTYLIKPLLDLVDNNKIAIHAAVELSFIDTESQSLIYNISSENVEFTINIKKATLLRQFFILEKLTNLNIFGILSGSIKDTKPLKMKKPRKTKFFKIHTNIIDKYFDNENKNEEIEEIIEQALEMYFTKNKVNNN